MSIGTQEFSVGQWRDINSHRRYPFADNATLAVIDHLPLPMSTLVDARVYLPGMTGTLSLAGFVVTGSQVILTLQNSFGNLQAEAVIDRDNPVPVIEIRDEAGNPAGVLVAGDNVWAEFANYGRGEFEFLPGAAEFAIATYTYSAPTSYKVLSPEGDPVPGTLRLIGENGVRLSCEQRGDQLRVSVHVVGDSLYKTNDCDLDLIQSSQLIETVVFQSGSRLITCHPDEHGRIFVLSATHAREDVALRVKSIEAGLQFGIAGRSL